MNKIDNNMEQKVRLTESDLHKVIKQTVKKVLKESYYDDNAINSGLWNNLVDNLGAEQVLSYIVKYSGPEQCRRWYDMIVQEIK